jgi:hypothetical protein
MTLNRYLLLTLATAIGFAWAIDAARVCAEPAESKDETSRVAISRVATMPNLPEPLAIRDWDQVTRNYLDVMLDFDRTGPHLPLVRWMDDDQQMVAIPSYIGGPRKTEAVNVLAAVVSGALVGIDMQDFHGQDWVRLAKEFYNEQEGVCVNRLGASTGHSFWYDVFPNVLFYQVNACYPDDPERERKARTAAVRWYKACVAMGADAESGELPDFDHTGFSLETMQPFEQGWIEPEAAAGLAWMEYMAWLKYQDPRFLTAADWALRALESRPDDESPLYEVLLPYGALAAARMNAERGTDYDVERLVNQCFDPRPRPQARPGWGVIADRWHGCDMHGLVGSTTDGEGYAFAMNTYQWAGALVPLARYDTRYARDVGKWMLNLTNASRTFYAHAHDAAHQSSYDWSRTNDPKSCIAYEGIRKWKRDACLAQEDVATKGGRILQGSYESTHARHESPRSTEVLQETAGAEEAFEHVWKFALPAGPQRWLVVAAERIDGGHLGNAFQFSFADDLDGTFVPAFSITGDGGPQVVEIPSAFQGDLYVKVASRNRLPAWSGPDQLVVDAMAISCRSDIGPFAQGDQLVTFVTLLDEARSPIVLYRPADATTDFGLYGSSHVGILGGIVRTTNVDGILQLDLLKTDYFHDQAYPTYLYYNPHDSEKTVELALGERSCDLYDAVSDQVIQSNASDTASIEIPADSARIIVLAPAGGELRREGAKSLVDNIVVRH